jgi:hypothetical protein
MIELHPLPSPPQLPEFVAIADGIAPAAAQGSILPSLTCYAIFAASCAPLHTFLDRRRILRLRRICDCAFPDLLTFVHFSLTEPTETRFAATKIKSHH